MTLGNDVSFPCNENQDKGRFVYQWSYAKNPSASLSVYHFDFTQQNTPGQNEDV